MFKRPNGEGLTYQLLFYGGTNPEAQILPWLKEARTKRQNGRLWDIALSVAGPKLSNKSQVYLKSVGLWAKYFSFCRL